MVLIGGGIFVLEKTGVTNLFSRDNTTTSQETPGINYNPPTEEEKQAGDKQKDQTLKEEDERNDPENLNKYTASVIITDAGQYEDIIEVRAFIPDYYQDGSCIITFTQGEQTVTKETPAYRDASTTICTNPLFERSEFPNGGDWQVRVTYKSTGAEGISNPTIVNIN